MQSQIVHILDGEEPVGTYPAWIVPHLVKTQKLRPAMRWYCDGMTETLSVGELCVALNPPESPMPSRVPPSSPMQVAPVEVKAVRIPARQVFNISLAAMLSVVFASPVLLVVGWIVWTFVFVALTK
jgi:hypothetical protein